MKAIRRISLAVVLFVFAMSQAARSSKVIAAPGALSLVVNTTVDMADANPGDGICEATLGHGDCTLRAALMEANSQLHTTTSITVPAGTFQLSAARGSLKLSKPVTLTGAGSGKTIIDGNGAVTHDRVLEMDLQAGTLTIQGLTLQGGNVTNGSGGGIYIFSGNDVVSTSAVYLLEDVEITQNTAGGTKASGGGLYIYGYHTATLSLSHVNIHDNQVNSDSNAGAGMLIDTADYGWGAPDTVVTLEDSVIKNNQAVPQTTGYPLGGGIDVRHGNLTVLRSTLYHNSASYGGGISVDSSDSGCAIVDSTLSGNQALLNGGGLYATAGGIGLFSATVMNNVAGSNLMASGLGGGIFNQGASIELHNSLIVGNKESHFNTLLHFWFRASGDLRGSYQSGGYNAISDPADATFSGSHSLDLSSITLSKIGPLAMNGGFSGTHALLAGSEAINAGKPTGCLDQQGDPLTTDQRGDPRVMFGRCDIGAFEYNPTFFLPFVIR